jgi:polysaccharide deacetylase 2 family uncharacterized protein YibQ
MKVLEKLPKIPVPTKHLWAGLAVSLTLLLVSLYVGRFSFGDEERIAQALRTAHRLEYTISTQTFKGDIRESAIARKEREKKEKEQKDALISDQMLYETITAELQQQQLDSEQSSTSKPAAKDTKKYPKVPITDISKEPAIAIVITGLGLSTTSTTEALELPPSVTLGFSPYSPQLDKWTKSAIESKHDIILNIPMETKDFMMHDPGPYALLKDAAIKDNLVRLRMLLALTKESIGIYSDKGEVFSSYPEAMGKILHFFDQQKIWYIFGGGYKNISLFQMAQKFDYPILTTDLYLDEEIDTPSINEKLREAKKIAKEKGYAVIFARPYPITIRILQQWLVREKNNGINFLPVSQLLGKYVLDRDVEPTAPTTDLEKDATSGTPEPTTNTEPKIVPSEPKIEETTSGTEPTSERKTETPPTSTPEPADKNSSDTDTTASSEKEEKTPAIEADTAVPTANSDIETKTETRTPVVIETKPETEALPEEQPAPKEQPAKEQTSSEERAQKKEPAVAPETTASRPQETTDKESANDNAAPTPAVP